MTNEVQPILEVRDITKRFDGVTALAGVSLSVRPGEVHAVIGENGAGKSTLMKILAGVHAPDTGTILFQGQPVELDSVHQALAHGIALIHQELNLADNLNVGANIFLGREPTRFGAIDFRKIEAESKTLLAKVGLNISPNTLVSRLTIGLQQLVEIAKALSTNARVLIMDEPTSSLSQHETEALFRIIEDLKQRGVCIIYISHRLGEIKHLADRITVLRDGKIAGHLEKDEISQQSMVELMVGRDIDQFYSHTPHPPGDVVFKVDGVVTHAWPEQTIDLEIRSGEMVGIAGLVGAGRTELLTTIFGITPPLKGSVSVEGKPIKLQHCRSAIAAGVALVPEDRKGQGVILPLPIRNNIGLPNLGRNQRPLGFLNGQQEKQDSAEMMREMKIKAPTDSQLVQFLSGGNQQKVVIGKWLANSPKVLLMDEPTRGVDIGAKQEIYRLMEQLTEQGVAILFVSSEMEEVLSLSDRLLVMHEGRIMGQLSREEMSEEAVMHLATGHDSVVTN